MQHNLVNRLASIPGVSEVSILGGLPMTGSMSQDPIFASDHTYAANQIPPLRRFITAAPGAFHALGTPMRAGREFTWTEIHQSRRVVIISENFAREYWGSAQAAIGKQIRSNPNDPWSEVIGVAGDLRHDGADKKAPTCVYWPLRSQNSMPFLIRSSRAGTDSFLTEIRKTVWAVNGSLPITEIRTMKQIYDKSMARTAFTLTLLAISGGMALLLAVVGIYAVISYTVAQRTQGNRHPHGARRTTGRAEEDVRRQRPSLERNRRGGRTHRRGRAFTADVRAAIRNQPRGSSHIYGRWCWHTRSGSGGQLLARAPGHACGSCRSAAGRVK